MTKDQAHTIMTRALSYGIACIHGYEQTRKAYGDLEAAINAATVGSNGKVETTLDERKEIDESVTNGMSDGLCRGCGRPYRPTDHCRQYCLSCWMANRAAAQK